MSERDFLVFRLSGLMSSWGDITVGERRSIWGEPSKSAVLGLIAAAMGLDRRNDAAHEALEAGLGFALRLDAPGRPLRDYHTAQAPKVRKNLSWRTRKEELADRSNLNTVLSERLYRLEAKATIALWLKGDGVDLADLSKAMAQPRYSLSLGRKACPLSEPLWPQVIKAGGLEEAFFGYDQLRSPLDDVVAGKLARAWHQDKAAQPLAIWFELEAGLAEDAAAMIIRQRRDCVRTRSRHLFTDRREGRLPRLVLDPGSVDHLKGVVA